MATTPVKPAITPMQFPPQNYVPGRFAPWPCSPEPIYGPDELGELVSVIRDMSENVNRCDPAARIWEVLQAWEMRLFRRGYHFLNCGYRGWGMAGQTAGNGASQIAMQTANSMKLFACNVIGARHKKITALLSREVPGMDIAPIDEEDPMDQTAAEEAEKFLEVFQYQADLKDLVTRIAGYFCTDGRVGLLTYTWADQTQWGTETPMRQQIAYGPEESEGLTPENELDPAPMDDETPARREMTLVGGKLEWKVPIMSDDEAEMPHARFQHEVSVNRLKAKYPWIRSKITTGGNPGGTDQIDRLARINVRLAVQASSSSGESYKNDATETVTFFQPSEYESIADDAIRQIWYQTFPDGMEVWHAGGEFAFCRNARMSDHVKIIHPGPGDGQNREAILTNYLPLQKVLNANISLLDRYFRSAVARRFAKEGAIDTQQINSQSNDPANITPVRLGDGETIDQITGVENVPVPNTSQVEFIQWLIQGGPEAMDGGSPAAFGDMETSSEDRGFVGTARLRREQALQVFGMPWAAICEAVCSISQQAVESAAKNRISDISASLPGQKKLKIEIGKLQGSVLIQPESLEIPQTLAEQEEQMAGLLEQSANVKLYAQIVNDPSNLVVFSNFPTLSKTNIPGVGDVMAQQGEFEILSKSGPLPNPQFEQLQMQAQMGAADPEAQTPEGQAAMQQLQQAIQSMPQQISTVPVAQDTSEDHAIHAEITLQFLKSAAGRKLKYGDDQQKQIYRNFLLHWQEHMAVLKQLTPPPQVEMKANITVDPTKLPPEAQAKAFQALGLQVSPQDVTPEDQTHEVVQEKEGVDEQGIPTKTKVSVAGKPLK